jgi:hypothetical protein
MGKESIESMEADHKAGEHHVKDFTSTGHVHTDIAAGPYTGLERPLKERVAADHERASVQLKAEHQKELAALKAEEVQKLADLKAEHAMTEGGTGIIDKLKGRVDPIKQAEKMQLRAEIARAKEAIKAEHGYETAALKSKRDKEIAALSAAEKLSHPSDKMAHPAVYHDTPGLYDAAGVPTSGLPLQSGSVYQQPQMTQPLLQPHMVQQPVVAQPVLQATGAQPVLQTAGVQPVFQTTGVQPVFQTTGQPVLQTGQPTVHNTTTWR